MQFLLKNGANIEIQNYKGHTALHYASEGSYLKVAKLLIEKGAKVKAKNNEGETAFDIAKKQSNKKLMELFENFQRKDK